MKDSTGVTVLLIFIIAVLVLFNVLCFTRVISVEFPEKDSFSFTVPESRQDIVDRCINLPKKESAECIVANVKTFYKFNITSNPKSFDELMKNGGDCLDYSQFYASLAEDLGLDYHYTWLDIADGKKHQIVIIYDKTGYCFLDNTFYSCYAYKEY